MSNAHQRACTISLEPSKKATLKVGQTQRIIRRRLHYLLISSWTAARDCCWRLHTQTIARCESSCPQRGFSAGGLGNNEAVPLGVCWLQSLLDQDCPESALGPLCVASSCSMVALTYLKHSMPKLLEAIHIQENKPRDTTDLADTLHKIIA